MATTLKEYVTEHRPEGFRSVPLYFPGGDFLSYYISDRRCYAKRIDDVVTVYLAFGSEELVGCKIKGVKHILRTAGGFRVNIDSDEVTLGFFFLIGGGSDRADRDPKWNERLKTIADVKVNTRQLSLA